MSANRVADGRRMTPVVRKISIGHDHHAGMIFPVESCQGPFDQRLLRQNGQALVDSSQARALAPARMATVVSDMVDSVSA